MEVQPIRDLGKIEEIKMRLNEKSDRDFLLFFFGINTGLRISDMLKLRVSDVRNKVHIELVEQKTGKNKRFKINPKLREYLEQYTMDKEDDEFLFKSREGHNRPITRIQAYNILKNVAKEVGLNDNIGCHTMRKTMGYWHYKRNGDVAILQKIFNHSAPSVTLRYIGISQDIIDESMEDFCL